MATRRPRTRPWTRTDLLRLPDDGNRYEVLDGELFVTPQATFGHQEVAMRFAMVLRAHCQAHRIGIVVGPGAVVFGKNELQPDVQVIPGMDHSPDAEWHKLPKPILVVEVLSSSTTRRDLGKKRDAYLRIGTPEYWTVDRHEKTVDVSRPGVASAECVRDELRWRPPGSAPELTIALSTIFK